MKTTSKRMLAITMVAMLVLAGISPATLNVAKAETISTVTLVRNNLTALNGVYSVPFLGGTFYFVAEQGGGNYFSWYSEGVYITEVTIDAASANTSPVTRTYPGGSMGPDPDPLDPNAPLFFIPGPSGNHTAQIKTITINGFPVVSPPLNTPPVITLLGDATVNLTVGDIYSDAGATALDAEDGDLTDDIDVVNPVNTAVAGTYTVTYNVVDSQGLAAVEVTRTVIVSEVPQNTPPVITLLGDATVNLTVGDIYNDAGATALDAEDGDLTDDIDVVNPVNTAVAGTYIITYNVEDSEGLAAVEVTRTVIVSATAPPSPPPGPPTVFFYNIVATTEGGGTVGGGGTFSFGASTSVSATASEGYTFLGWYEGGTLVSTSPTFGLTVTGSRTLVAVFEEDEVEIPEVEIPEAPEEPEEPVVEEPEEEIELEDPIVPTAPELPETGELPFTIFYGLGAMISAAGIVVGKKRRR
jgi:LPXTG-motif cell wall-anchored protein